MSLGNAYATQGPLVFPRLAFGETLRQAAGAPLTPRARSDHAGSAHLQELLPPPRAQRRAVQLDQRLQQLAALADPVGERGAIQIDAFAGVDLALPVQRQVIGILGHQHMREQPNQQSRGAASGHCAEGATEDGPQESANAQHADEQEGQHAADQHRGHDLRVGDLDDQGFPAVGGLVGSLEGGEQGECGECGGSDGEALADGGGGVAGQRAL